MDHPEIRGCGVNLLMDELILGLFQDLWPCVMDDFLWQVTNYWNKAIYSSSSDFQSPVPFETMVLTEGVTLTAAKMISNSVQALWPWSRSFTESFRSISCCLKPAISLILLYYYFYIGSSFIHTLIYNTVIQYLINGKILLISCKV